MASADLRDELSCSICLNVYSDPVTLRCGHNFCWKCIDRVLDSQRGQRSYSCPDCRQTFSKRPSLYRNVTLRSVVKHFQPTPGRVGAAAVLCTYCLHFPVPAVKSCVLCEASLCSGHLEVHNKAPEHVLIEPSISFQSRKCSVHNQILEYYCPKDEVCICVYCRVDGDHNNHKVQSLDEASEEKKKTVMQVLEKLSSRKKEAESKIQDLHKHLRNEEDKAVRMKGKVSALFVDIRKQLEDLEDKVLSDISGMEEQVSVLILDRIKELETKKNRLCQTMGQIQEMCKMTDPIMVLQDPKWEDNVQWCSGEDEQLCHQEAENPEDLDEDLMKKAIHDQVSELTSHVNPWLFLLNPLDLLLDVDMAADNLYISEDLKTASLTYQDGNVNLESFLENEVLSTQSFSSGQHYWEVDTSKSGNWRLGVKYPYRNDVSGASWALWRNYNQCLAVHESNIVHLSNNLYCQRFGVYLNYEAGQLSFYQLDDPVRHLHTFRATFTEPLYASFWLNSDDYAAWVKIKS